MLFNSWLFLGAFLPFTLFVALVLLRGGGRIWFLIAANLSFYAFSGLEHGLLLTASIIWVHFWTRGGETISGWRVAGAAVLPIGALVYYKYLGFLIADVLYPLGISGIAAPQSSDYTLPAGISFFSFQLVSYAIDRKRGLIPEPERFSRFALLVSFFPHLVAGPILRYHHVAQELKQLPFWHLKAEIVPKAIALVVGGLALKVLIADRLADTIAPLTADLSILARGDAVFTLLAYHFQIYFDFYGYSLIAIGLALFFGFRFPSNFHLPYTASSPKEFWRRWHMTLSYWIRDYLYLPLGGNRHYIRNIVITFAICGLWHGAGWNFIVWGLYHAFLVCIYHILQAPWQRLPRVIQIALTFTLVAFGWTLFLFDFDAWLVFMGRLVSPTASGMTVDAWHWLWLLVICLPLALFAEVEAWAEDVTRSPARLYAASAAGTALFFAVLLYLDLSSAFIYFRF